MTFWFLLLEVIVWSVTGVGMRVIKWFVCRKDDYRQVQNLSKKEGDRTFSISVKSDQKNNFLYQVGMGFESLCCLVIVFYIRVVFDAINNYWCASFCFSYMLSLYMHRLLLFYYFFRIDIFHFLRLGLRLSAKCEELVSRGEDLFGFTK